jgi:hypothetical protein
MIRIGKMKKNQNMKYFILRISLVISLAVTFSVTESVQGADSETAEKKDGDSKVKFYAEAGIEYTDNPFRLTESQISKMEENAVEDMAGGRFKDMDSVSDYLIIPEIGFNYGTDSPLGGRLALNSWVRYNYCMENRNRSFLEGRIRLKNSIGKNGSLSLEGNILLDYYKKNYLSGINDENENGNATREERIYSPAVYDEYEWMISYEHKLIKDKDKRISGMDITPFAGYGIRRHNSIFRNRDLDIPFLGMGIALEFISRIDIDMTYKYEWVSAPGNQELILFDETLRGTDVNYDGEIKANAPVITGIDRSSKRYSVEIKPSFKFSKDTLLSLGYRKRVSAYESDNSLDIEHCDQHAYRDRISLGLRHDFSKAWSAETEYSRTHEDEEDGEYSENSILMKIKYDF